MTFLQEDEHLPKKRRFLVQNSKKFGCPAQLVMREVVKFPKFKVCLTIFMY